MALSKNIASDFQESPKAFVLSLRKIVFWIGLERIGRRRPLIEEPAICHLLFNYLDDAFGHGFDVEKEAHYNELSPGARLPTIFVGGEEADFAVFRRKTRAAARRLLYVVEVKKGDASTARTNKDLLRLSEYRQTHPDVRAFLFVVSEGQLPLRFVHPDGTSIRGQHPIPRSRGYFRVRRTFKALHARSVIDRGQFACLVEVYPGPRDH